MVSRSNSSENSESWKSFLNWVHGKSSQETHLEQSVNLWNSLFRRLQKIYKTQMKASLQKIVEKLSQNWNRRSWKNRKCKIEQSKKLSNWETPMETELAEWRDRSANLRIFGLPQKVVYETMNSVRSIRSNYGKCPRIYVQNKGHVVCLRVISKGHRLPLRDNGQLTMINRFFLRSAKMLERKVPGKEKNNRRTKFMRRHFLSQIINFWNAERRCWSGKLKIKFSESIEFLRAAVSFILLQRVFGTLFSRTPARNSTTRKRFKSYEGQIFCSHMFAKTLRRHKNTFELLLVILMKYIPKLYWDYSWTWIFKNSVSISILFK